MKKRYFALLLCVHMVLFMIFQAASNVMAEEDAVTRIDAQTDNEENSQGQAENSSEWLSYEDFILSETTKAWNDPAMYVGFTAEFNTEMYGNFACVSSGDVIDFGSDADVSKGDVNVSDGDTDVTGVDADITDPDTDYCGDDTDFFYSGDDFYEKLLTFANFVYEEELLDAEGNGIKVIITDYYFDDTSDSLWYKVEAVEGYTLPDVLVENPYVLHLTYPEEEPCILMHPRKAMFVGDKVIVQKNPVAASRFEEVAVDELPDFFDITWSYEYTDNYGLSWYDFGDISGWAENLTPEYRYISTSYVKLIPAEVSHAYEMLMSTEDVEDYEAYLSQIPEEITRQFTDKHIANLEEHQEYLRALENVEHSTNVMVGNKEIPITVTGKIPETGVTLNVSAVSAKSVLQEGFDIKDATEIVTALDIKMINDNGTEWQPEEGKMITLSIDMAALGYEDGQIFRLHHKHGEEIDVYDVFVVMDGKLTMGTYGFSLYVISDLNDFNQDAPGTNGTAVQLNNNSKEISLTVGQTVVYYFTPTGNENAFPNNQNNLKSTWWVTDPDGAIYYELYSSTRPGTNGVNARWIRITALKETTQAVELNYLYVGQNNAVNQNIYNLSIVVPEPEETDIDNYKLYVKDTVNTSGLITATLVDKNGNEVTEETLGGKITCSWVRDDGAYIVPDAYANDGRSVNICIDHAGLLQNRLENITYSVTVTLPNGIEKAASYTVYYQSEILNSSFEAPVVTNNNYTFLTNGWPGLYWKTTSPGNGTSNLSKDVEFARYNGTNSFNGTSFYPTRPEDGNQLAELNAENFGALYQDIITAPGEDVIWEFEHAKRNTDTTNAGRQDEEAMFLIIGPTEYAQEKTDYEEITTLVENILDANGGRNEAIAKMAGNNSISYTETITRDGKSVNVTYQVWYHNADRQTGVTAANAWTKMEGSYKVPSGQYRTRMFFVTDPGIVYQKNYGNLIDSAMGGQYKRYLIEYYRQTYETDAQGNPVVIYTHVEDYDEDDRAIMYASVPLKNFGNFEANNELLAEVFINGENSPYNIKYSNTPCLFIGKYSTDTTNVEPLDKTKELPEDHYSKYDIVMQVCFRDTIIAVQKWVEFPKVTVDGETKEALTAVEKQNLVAALGNGYQASFVLECAEEECNNNQNGHFDEEVISIVKNDPYGFYTGYISIGGNPAGDHNFTLTEEYVSSIPGLEIDKVTFQYAWFKNGQRQLETPITYSVAIEEVTEGNQTKYKLVNKTTPNDKGVSQKDIIINTETTDSEGNYRKLAEIQVTNAYKEKLVKYNYVAIGNGKIAVQDTDKTPTTSDSETFAYYSGKPLGVKPQADTKYTFAGWYLDEDCTLPVDENHGYVDADGGFIPNKAKTVSDNVLEVTYYAKFSIGSLQIIREDAEPGQVFVYKVEDANGETMYVTVVIGDDGTGSTEIVNASFGDNKEGRNYTVTQLNSWSWRYGSKPVSVTKKHEETEGLHGSTNMTTVFRFPKDLESLEQKSDYWLNGNSNVEINTYGGGAN